MIEPAHLPRAAPKQCRNCDGTQHVCEYHMDRPWPEMSNSPDACDCGQGAGAYCPVCRPEMQPAACTLQAVINQATMADRDAKRSTAAVEVVAKAIHEGRSDIPWEVTASQDVAYRDARAAIAAIAAMTGEASAPK